VPPEYKLINGDCLTVMASMRPNSVDAIVTDPPYGLNFMGKNWDHGVPGIPFWAAALRIMKPGAYMLAFGGTRTHHRLMCAIEDAGFELRDCLMWLYGSGFPKSHDISKAIDKAAGVEREVVGPLPNKATPGPARTMGRPNGAQRGWQDNPMLTAPSTDEAKRWEGFGTALKPAYEIIILAQKPREETFANNVLKYGVGGLNIDGCRVSPGSAVPGGGNGEASHGGRYGTGETSGERPKVEPHTQGRWPANLILDEEAGAMLDEQSGKIKPGYYSGATSKGMGFHGASNSDTDRSKKSRSTNDSGGASRFFYCPKVSKKERGEGNNHPTIKPQALMRYLCRLITPPNGIILDPFMGSASTILAARDEGFRAIGIEKEEAYYEIAQNRLKEPPCLNETTSAPRSTSSATAKTS